MVYFVCNLFKVLFVVAVYSALLAAAPAVMGLCPFLDAFLALYGPALVLWWTLEGRHIRDAAWTGWHVSMRYIIGAGGY
jgi:hypothetical protein